MKNEITQQNTLRLYKVQLIEQLNKDFKESNFKSINDYLTFCLESYLNSKQDLKEQIEFINRTLKQKNLINYKFEEELIDTLKAIVRKLDVNEKLTIRQLELLRRWLFNYPLDEQSFVNGKYDKEFPIEFKDYYSGE